MATQPCGPLRGWKAYTLASAAPGQESLRNFLELSELPRAASHPPPGLPDPGLPDPGLPSSGALPISTRGAEGRAGEVGPEAAWGLPAGLGHGTSGSWGAAGPPDAAQEGDTPDSGWGVPGMGLRPQTHLTRLPPPEVLPAAGPLKAHPANALVADQPASLSAKQLRSQTLGTFQQALGLSHKASPSLRWDGCGPLPSLPELLRSRRKRWGEHIPIL